MPDGNSDAASLRERLVCLTEDRLGRAFSDVLENPLLTSAIGRALDAREKAAQAQELAMGALNLPSAADIERLTRRLRSVSQRLEAIEDVVDRIDQTLHGHALNQRLAAIEEQLRALAPAEAPNDSPEPAGGAPAGGTEGTGDAPSKSPGKGTSARKPAAVARKPSTTASEPPAAASKRPPADGETRRAQ